MNLEERLRTEDAAAGALPHYERHPLISTDARTSSGIRYLTKPQVCAVLNVSPTGLWELMNKADFPRPRVLYADPTSTSGRSYWLLHEVQEFMLSRPPRVIKADRAAGGVQ